MMKEMNDEMMEVIRKNLPAQTMGVLAEELEELSRLRGIEAELTTCKEQLKAEKSKSDGLQKELQAYQVREELLRMREEKVLSAEIRQEVSKLTIQLEEANKRADISKELVSTLFKSKTTIETINSLLTNGGSPYFSSLPGGGYGVAAPAEQGRTTVREEG